MKENPRFDKSSIGSYSYGTPTVMFPESGATLIVGKFVSIADGVVIMLGGEHKVDWVTTYPLNQLFPEWSTIKGHPATKGNVIIGNDVWIGREALILSGVTVGDGAVIGARAVVTKDVMPYSIVAGNPAKHIRFRFDTETISKLVGIEWWNWPEKTIREMTPYLLSNDPASIIAFSHSKVTKGQA